MEFLNDLLGDNINVDVNVKIDEQSAFILGATVFLSIFAALFLAGFILKKI